MITTRLLNKLITLVVVAFVLTNCAGGSIGGGGLGSGFGSGSGLTSNNAGSDLAPDGVDDTDVLFESAVGSGAANQNDAFLGGGYDNNPGVSEKNSSAGGVGASHFSSSEPVDIPITIAKATKPNVEHILVDIEEVDDAANDGEPDEEVDEENEDHGHGPSKMVSYKFAISGLPGAVPNPAENSYVYAFNPLTGVEMFSKVEADGSFAPIEMVSKMKNQIVVAVSDQKVIGEPILLKPINKKVFIWRNDGSEKPIAVGSYSRVATLPTNSYLIVRQSKDGIADDSLSDLKSSKDSMIDKPLIERAVPVADSKEGSKDTTRTAVPKEEASRKDQTTTVIIRESNGKVTSVNDTREVGSNLFFRNGNAIYNKNNDDEFKSIYSVSKNERINRWDILKKSPSAELPKDERYPDPSWSPRSDNVDSQKDERYPDPSWSPKNDNESSQYLGVITKTQIKLIDVDTQKVILQKNIEDVSDRTFFQIEKQEPIEKIITSVFRGL